MRHVLALTLPAADLQGPLRTGALLALTPDLSGRRLGVRTASGRRLFAVLRDYGAYIVGPSAGAAAGLRVDAALARATPGPPSATTWPVLVGALDRVTNSRPGAIGGPGPRRAPAKRTLPRGRAPRAHRPCRRSRRRPPGPGTGTVPGLARAAGERPTAAAPPAAADAGLPPAAGGGPVGVAGLAAALLTIGLRAGFRLVR